MNDPKDDPDAPLPPLQIEALPDVDRWVVSRMEPRLPGYVWLRAAGTDGRPVGPEYLVKADEFQKVDPSKVAN